MNRIVRYFHLAECHVGMSVERHRFPGYLSATMMQVQGLTLEAAGLIGLVSADGESGQVGVCLIASWHGILDHPWLEVDKRWR